MTPRGILLDIEGTTSSISFVVDVMFPFVLKRLDAFLEEHFAKPNVQQAAEQIARDAGAVSLSAWAETRGVPPRELVTAEVQRLMASDVKATGLKTLQGLIWDGGFRSGELKAHVYPDVIPAIERWRAVGIDVRIYSSGSIAAQKLFFGHLAEYGDCLGLFSGHYDTTIGPKTAAASYLAIAEDWQVASTDILFISDNAAELQGASQAGLQTLASVRPGNSSLPSSYAGLQVTSFAEVPV